MAGAKKITNRILFAITNVESTLEQLKIEYEEKPSKPLYSIIIAQELSLMELKNIYHTQK